jgi:hypothetical protein
MVLLCFLIEFAFGHQPKLFKFAVCGRRKYPTSINGLANITDYLFEDLNATIVNDTSEAAILIGVHDMNNSGETTVVIILQIGF